MKFGSAKIMRSTILLHVNKSTEEVECLDEHYNDTHVTRTRVYSLAESQEENRRRRQHTHTHTRYVCIGDSSDKLKSDTAEKITRLLTVMVHSALPLGQAAKLSTNCVHT